MPDASIVRTTAPPASVGTGGASTTDSDQDATRDPLPPTSLRTEHTIGARAAGGSRAVSSSADSVAVVDHGAWDSDDSMLALEFVADSSDSENESVVFVSRV